MGRLPGEDAASYIRKAGPEREEGSPAVGDPSSSIARFSARTAFERCSGLPDLEHPGAADRAASLGCRHAVLHGDGFRVFDFPFHPALEAVGFQLVLLLVATREMGSYRRIVRVSTQMHSFAEYNRHNRSLLPRCQD